MCIKKYNPNDPRFEKLNTKPLPLVNDSVRKLVTITQDWIYNCLCAVSKNVIFIHNDWSVWCDVNQEWVTHCKVVWLEHEICPYRVNMVKKELS